MIQWEDVFGLTSTVEIMHHASVQLYVDDGVQVVGATCIIIII